MNKDKRLTGVSTSVVPSYPMVRKPSEISFRLALCCAGKPLLREKVLLTYALHAKRLCKLELPTVRSKAILIIVEIERDLKLLTVMSSNSLHQRRKFAPNVILNTYL